MAKSTEKKVYDVPETKPFTGMLLGTKKPVDFSPKELFDSIIKGQIEDKYLGELVKLADYKNGKLVKGKKYKELEAIRDKEVAKNLKVSRINYPIWKVRPTDPIEKSQLEAEENRCASLGFLWAKDQGFDMAEISGCSDWDDEKGGLKDGVLFHALDQYQKSITDHSIKNNIVRSCIVGFGKDEFSDGMNEDDFDLLHPILKKSFVKKIDEISNIPMGDMLGL